MSAEAYHDKPNAPAADVRRCRSGWNVPARLLEKPLAELERHAQWAAVHLRLAALLGTGATVALCGPRGAGKSQLAVQLMRCATLHSRTAYYTDAMGFFLDLKATFGERSGSERDVVERYCRPALLVLDELGKRGESDWHEQLLFCVLDRRYAAMKDTVLVDNRGKAELEKALGDSVVSRMNERGGIVQCSWGSFRK